MKTGKRKRSKCERKRKRIKDKMNRECEKYNILKSPTPTLSWGRKNTADVLRGRNMSKG
jgi:hypothetical protein